MKYELGWTAYAALGVIVAATIGALSFYGLFNIVPEEAIKVAPWVLVSLFLLPIAYAVQVLIKLWELNSVKGLSNNERRRLAHIIKGKTRQFFIAIMFYVLSAALIVILYSFTSIENGLFKLSIIITGGLLGISIFTVALIFSEMKEVYDFSNDLQVRKEVNEKKKIALNKLKDNKD